MSKYDIILDVFRTGSISKTAQSKNYSQPAVSQIISSFEKEIGFSVFKREKNGLFPTRQGALLFDSILKITQEENKIQKSYSLALPQIEAPLRSVLLRVSVRIGFPRFWKCFLSIIPPSIMN